LPDDPRIRDLRVTPHALDRYDELCALHDPADDAAAGDGPPLDGYDEDGAP
jgi:hypothetical protein